MLAARPCRPWRRTPASKRKEEEERGPGPAPRRGAEKKRRKRRRRRRKRRRRRRKRRGRRRKKKEKHGIYWRKTPPRILSIRNKSTEQAKSLSKQHQKTPTGHKGSKPKVRSRKFLPTCASDKRDCFQTVFRSTMPHNKAKT